MTYSPSSQSPSNSSNHPDYFNYSDPSNGHADNTGPSLKQEFIIFLGAFTLLTRIPIPKRLSAFEPESRHLQHSKRYFTLVGLLIGLIMAGGFTLFLMLFNRELALILTMLLGVMVTGGLHEDGFADSCDVFGAGATGSNKNRILAIMKDSRIGAFAAIGLILLFLVKFTALKNIPFYQVAKVLILANGGSRFFLTLLIQYLPYIRPIENSRMHQHLEKKGHKKLEDILVPAALLLLASVLMFSFLHFAIAMLISGMVTLLMFYYLKKRFEGFTGDLLGACQQILELTFYLIFSSHLWISI